MPYDDDENNAEQADGDVKPGPVKFEFNVGGVSSSKDGPEKHNQENDDANDDDEDLEEGNEENGAKEREEDGKLSVVGDASANRQERGSKVSRDKRVGNIVWNHIIVSENKDGVNEQLCRHCGRKKTSRQLQTTFWAQHLVDNSTKGCPNAPNEARQMLLAASRSANVRRFSSEHGDIAHLPHIGKSKSSAERHSKKKRKMEGKQIANDGSENLVVKIACICGSQRAGSFNKMLMNETMRYLEAEGAELKVIDLKSLKLPIYDADLEAEHFPAEAHELKSDLVGADGILIVSPEYNGFISPLLLNAITWATRGNGRSYAGFKNKVVCIMSASPGTMGGLRMIRSLQQMMQDMGAIVTTGNHAYGNAFHVFDRTGRVTDDRASKKIVATCYRFVNLVRSHSAVVQSDEKRTEDDNHMEQELAKIPNLGEYGRAEW